MESVMNLTSFLLRDTQYYALAVNKSKTN